MRITFQAMEGTAKEVAELVETVGLTWPFMMVPDFREEGEFMQTLTGFPAVWLAPLVGGDNRDTWDAYVTEKSSKPIHPSMYKVDNSTIVNVEGAGPFAPVRQMYPSLRHKIDGVYTPINYDIFSNPLHASLAFAVNEMRGAAMFPVLLMPVFSYSLGLPSSIEKPMSEILQPIFNFDVDDGDDEESEAAQKTGNDNDEDYRRQLKIEDQDGRDEEGGKTEDAIEMVGFIEALISWKTYFSDVLLQESDSLHLFATRVARH